MADGNHEKKIKIATATVGILLFVAMMIAAVIGIATSYHNKSSSHASSSDNNVHTSKKAIEAICQPTHHIDSCIQTLNEAADNSTDPKELIKVAFNVTKKEIASALAKSETIKATASDPRGAQALDICREVVEYSINDLERSVESMSSFDSGKTNQFVEDLKVWLEGAMTYQEVCFDAFQDTEGDAGEKMRNLFNRSQELTQNALNIISHSSEVLQFIDLGSLTYNRRLLQQQPAAHAGDLPPWISDEKRRILNLPALSIKPDVIVAQDGTGQFTSINEALKLVPRDSGKAFVIYIKEGIYKEYIMIDQTLINVIFVGDGPTKTKITGNKNFADGVPTYLTATVDVNGNGFMAKDIGFENSAGPTKHQAVAIRVTSDYSIFFNCQFDGYQDTVYAVRSRQFYRDCTITGTIDFIFGDALAVFQNCKMVIRKPLDGQQCMVTAQGRKDPDGLGAMILQNCTIVGEPAYMAVKDASKAFLGRPWKEYGRTVIMQSYIDESIAPEGWAPWDAGMHMTTSFNAEFDNRGPGAVQTMRARWPGVKTLSPTEAQAFTPAQYFVSADAWIKPTGCPFYSHLAPL